MKNFILISSILTVAIFSTISQENILILKNRVTQKEKELEESKKIWVTTNDNKFFKDTFKILDSTHILIQADTLALSDIKVIGFRTPANKIIGASLIVIGAIGIGYGLYMAGVGIWYAVNFGLSNEFGLLYCVFMVDGVFLTSISSPIEILGIKLVSIHKNFEKQEWDFVIRKKLLSKNSNSALFKL